MDFDLPSVSQQPEETCDVSKKLGKKQRNRKVQSAPDLCKVCLTKATGYHYDVATCNRCKAFFRRIITEKLKYSCKFKSTCFDSLQPGDSVPKCPACRYAKCVETGMNPLGIESEMRKEMEKASSSMIVEKPRQTIDAQVGKLIDRMIRLDVQSEKFRNRGFEPKSYPTLRECVRQETSILSIADDPGNVDHVFLRNHVVAENVNDGRFALRSMLYELLTQLETVKAFPFFTNLSESDRFFLLRDTILMSSILSQSYYSFEKKSDRLLRPDGLRYFDTAFMFGEEFRSSLSDLSSRCLRAIIRNGVDRVEYVLLKVLVVMNPTVVDISEEAQNYLIRDRQKYMIALFRYEMAKHGSSGGPARFGTIIGFIDILAHQQRDQRDMDLLMRIRKPGTVFAPLVDEVLLN